MSGFVEVPASKRSLAVRGLVFSVGLNDSPHKVSAIVSGKKVFCPIYSTWVHMLERCFCPKLLAKRPTYINCTVAAEWLVLSNFREWMITQDYKGLQLDKDLLISGNKHYSPETCLFVTSQVNSLLSDRGGKRGVYPQGVSLNKPSGKFMANAHINGNQEYLGLFKTIKEAELAYKTSKQSEIRRVAELQTNNKVKQSLLSIADNYKGDTNERETEI